MRPITSYPRRRAIVRGLTLSVVATLTVGGIVACQGDQPVAPSRGAVSADTAASKYLYRPGLGSLTWQLEDSETWLLLGGGTFQLSSGASNITLNVTDNVAPDQDATSGKFKIVGLPPGTYTLCETVPPPKYMLPGPVPGPCQSVTVYNNVTTTAAPVFDTHVPLASWGVVDPVGNPLGGAYFQIRDSTFAVILSSSYDDSGFDLDNASGKWLKEFSARGLYYFCEGLAPSGWVPSTPACKGIYLAGGITPKALGNWVNNPTYSLYFNVTDPYGNPLSGTQFVIKRVNYPNNDIQVTDNFFPDRDATTGKYFVVVPAAGDYIVCQTTAPYGYDVPSVNGGCYPYVASVKYGVPTNAGTFVDKPWPVAR